jgi:hypothetical protein
MTVDHHSESPVRVGGDTTPERGSEFYRSRVVIAEFAGAAAAFGPVHTAGGLVNLAALLQARGWSVTGHTKLASLAQLRDHNSDWPSARPAASGATASGQWKQETADKCPVVTATGERSMREGNA